ncbi:MAG: hypothetical protein AB7U85_01795 [Alphaproteobacteria bacterium]
MSEDLYALIRLKKWEIDEKRRALADLFSQEEKVINNIKKLLEELEEEKRTAALDIQYRITYDIYVQKNIKIRQSLDGILIKTRQRIQEVQDELAILFQDLKTYEISQENREKRRAEELKIKEQNKLDEIGLNLHRRRHNDENHENDEEI